MHWFAVCIAVLAWAPSGVAVGDLWRRQDLRYAEFVAWLVLLLVPIIGPTTYRIMSVSPRRGGGAIVLLLAAVASWKVVLPVVVAVSSWGWLRVPTTRVEVSGPDMGGMRVKYDYTIDGRTHRSDRYGFVPPEDYMSEDELLGIQGHHEQYPVCYVAPWNHRSAVLVRQLSPYAFKWRAHWPIVGIALYLMRRRTLRLRSG